MMFRFTLASPNSQGTRQVHQVFGRHSADSIEDLAKSIRQDDVIVIEEFYAYDRSDGKERDIVSRGPKILNWNHVTKVDEYTVKPK